MKFIANTSDLNRYLGVDIAGNIPIKSISTDSRSIKKFIIYTIRVKILMVMILLKRP